MYLKLGNLYSSSANPVKDAREGRAVELSPEKLEAFKYEVWSATARDQLQEAADKILADVENGANVLLKPGEFGLYLPLKTKKFGECHLYGLLQILREKDKQ